MSARRRTPRREKSLDYRRQQSYLQYQRWGTRGKAVTHRSYRGQWRNHLAKLGRTTDPEVVEAVADPDWHLRLVALQGPTTTLLTRVIVATARRLVTGIENFRSQPYDPTRHAKPLIKGLTALPRLTGLSHARNDIVPWRTVESLNTLLSPPVHTTWHQWWCRWMGAEEVRQAELRRAWFTAFCRDQPSWERHLRSWVQQAYRLGR